MVYGFDPVDQKKLWEYNLYAPGTTQTPAVGQVMPDRDGNLQLLYQDGWSLKLGQASVVEASYVCLLTRNGLVALDPVKGTQLWIKSDVNSTRTQIFGDEQYVYLLDLGNDGAVTSANKAVRASDGVSVQVPDFAEAYGWKTASLGRTILVHDASPDAAVGGNLVRLRLYDVLTGKDLWKKEFPAGSVVLKSEAPELGGAVDPEGNVTLYDLRSRRVALSAVVEKKHLEKLQDAWVFADRDQFYLALNRATDPNANNGVLPSVMAGIRCLPVNGEVYAFNRASGKLNWHNDAPHQMLVLEQFRDLPILLFAAREWNNQGVPVPQPRNAQPPIKVLSFHKVTGKRKCDDTLQNTQNFHALVANPKAGIIDLVSSNAKLRHTLQPEEVKSSAENKAPSTAGEGGQASSAPEAIPAPVARPAPADPFKKE